MKIELITKENNLLEQGIEYFWKCWGSETNFDFYKDCIQNSNADISSLPKFFVLLEKDTIIGSYALLVNDLISRQDLMPWFACLHVNEEYRGRGLAEKLLNHGLNESEKRGFDTLYLSTDLKEFYEKKGWSFYANGYGVSGDEFKIYSKPTKTI